MLTDYDAIAEQYRRAKGQHWRTAIESYTLMGLVGRLAGRSVVDIACGEGFYTRRLRQAGAAKVVGIDLSEGMIDLARKEEDREPLGISYRIGDGKNLDLKREFDLAVAAYLLNYAGDRSELEAMCRGIAHSLRPGGRFVTVNSNPALDFTRLPSYRKYGFDVEADGKVGEGSPFTWTFYLEDGPIRVENYHLDVAAHEEALRSAGFRDVAWHQPRVDPDDPGAEGDEWDVFLRSPPLIFLECTM